MGLDKKLKYLRKKKGLSQLELADTMHVSRQAISRWEVGAAIPSTENLKYLSTLFGVSLEYLLNDTDENPEGEAPVGIQEQANVKKSKSLKKMTRWAAIGLCLLMAVLILMWIMRKQAETEISIEKMKGEQVETDPNRDFTLEW